MTKQRRHSYEYCHGYLRGTFMIALTFCGLAYIGAGCLILYPHLWVVLEPLTICCMVGAVVSMFPMAVYLLYRIISVWHGGGRPH